MWELLEKIPYLSAFIVMSLGIYKIFSTSDRLRKLIGLALFQNAILVFYISSGFVNNSLPPIVLEGASNHVYTNPLPSVLMLTAIVVGLATNIVGLCLVTKIENSDLLEKSRERQ